MRIGVDVIHIGHIIGTELEWSKMKLKINDSDVNQKVFDRQFLKIENKIKDFFSQTRTKIENCTV